MLTREASHAGSWYSDHKSTLSKQLDGWLDQVPDAIEGVGSIPLSGARAIIAPYVPAMSTDNHIQRLILLPAGTLATHTPVLLPLGLTNPLTSPKRTIQYLCEFGG